MAIMCGDGLGPHTPKSATDAAILRRPQPSPPDHGTRFEIEMEAKYQKSLRSVDMYLKLTAIANPHVTGR